MNKLTKDNIKLIIAIIVLILAAIIFLRLLSGEDNWVCKNGKWEKHGNPSGSAPTTQCK